MRRLLRVLAVLAVLALQLLEDHTNLFFRLLDLDPSALLATEFRSDLIEFQKR